MKSKFNKEGVFECFMKEGYGVLTKKSKERYCGHWKENYMHGYGMYIFADTTTYTGNFCKNFFEGYGRLSLKDNSFYEGEFKNGKPNGKGRYKIENLLYAGNFSEGRICGFCRILVFEKENLTESFNNQQQTTKLKSEEKIVRIVEFYAEAGLSSSYNNESGIKFGKIFFSNGDLLFEGELEGYKMKGKGVIKNSKTNIILKSGIFLEEGDTFNKNTSLFEPCKIYLHVANYYNLCSINNNEILSNKK